MNRANRELACALMAAVTVAAGTAAADKNSFDVAVTGCLKGRELTATAVADAERALDIVGRTFHVSGKRDVIDEVKRHNGRLVELTGSIKKAALATPGIKVGPARIVIGGSPMSNDPTRDPTRDPVARMLPLDATAVRLVEEACPAIKR